MIKHNLKLKGHKQDVIQTASTGKSLFYLTRRMVASRSGTITNEKQRAKNSYYQKNIQQQHYRSASTTPSNFRVSQNIDEGTFGCMTARQQSTSINSAEFLSSRNVQSHRVLSLYQQHAASVVDTVREEPQQLPPNRLRSINSDFVKIATQEYSIMDDICMNIKSGWVRKHIFKNQSYQDYKKLSKFKKQETGSKSIFVQKVLRNIKDAQGEKSEQKQFLRKFSNVWKDGFQQTFPEQQKFSKSQTQLKLYINQYIEKIMNKKRIYSNNFEQLSLISNHGCELQTQFTSENDLRQFYIENHNLKLPTEVEVEDQQFRYTREIKSYEMYNFEQYQIRIDIYNLNQYDDVMGESAFDIDIFFTNQVETKKIEYIQNSFPLNKNTYQLKPIINLLDTQTKNKLLSVDYTSMDQSIYFNNIQQIVPKIDETNPRITKFIKKQIYKRFELILTGHFINLNDLEDIEHNNAYQQQTVFQVDKKTIMNNLRNKTKEAKQQGRRSTLQMQLKFHPNLLTQVKNELQSSFITLQIPENDNKGQKFSRRRSKSMQSEDVSQSQDFSEIEPLDMTPSDNRAARPCKYKQQLRLQNLLMFEHAMKKDESVASIIQLLIEHNLVDELIDYLRQNPNFSLNTRNIEGKPFIVLAAQSGSLEIVQYMISRNVQLNVKDLDGNTPLHYAVGFQFYQIADELLKNGASPYIRNRLDLNAWNWQQYIQQ